MSKVISKGRIIASRSCLVLRITQRQAQVFGWVRADEASILAIEKPGVFEGSHAS
jgi:hypothetical protein